VVVSLLQILKLRLLIQAKIKTTNVFNKAYRSKTRITCLQGGTRSSKTYSLCQLFIVKCLEDTGRTFTIVRKTLPALKGTAYRDVLNILKDMELYSEENHNKSELSYLLNGNLIEFISVDQPQKIRGRKRNYLWLNEANELTYEDWTQLILRTTEQIYLDYNPSDPYSWIYEKVQTRDDCTFIKSTYKANPFLDEDTIAEIERLKDIDPDYWRVYGLGEIGSIQTMIFRNFNLVDDVQGKLIGYGLDFGFTNSPTALVEVRQLDDNLYIKELLYEKRLTNTDLANKLKEFGISRQTEIVGDSAEPKSIEEIYRQGFNIKPAKKGAGIHLGLDIMRRYKLHITKDSLNAIKEFRGYKWSTDKNGDVLNTPVKVNDHLIDATRYLCLNKLAVNHSGKYYIL
jgi:phage terminase large subunit